MIKTYTYHNQCAEIQGKEKVLKQIENDVLYTENNDSSNHIFFKRNDKMVFFPKLIYRLNVFPAPILVDVFVNPEFYR